MDFSAKLAAAAAKANIHLDAKQLALFNRYYELLTERDCIRDCDAAVEKIIDCLSCYDLAVFPANSRVIDVASGAGFPGVPLKILRPDIKLCLLDAYDQRLPFWREVVDYLALSDVTMVHARVEEFSQLPENREQYYVAISRGLFFHFSKLIEACLPLVQPAGYYIAFEFERTKDEVPESAASIAALGGELAKTVAQEIEKRIFVYVKKVRSTLTQD